MKKLLMLALCATIAKCDTENYKVFGDSTAVMETASEIFSDNGLQEQMQAIKDIFQISLNRIKSNAELVNQKMQSNPKLQSLEIVIRQQAEHLKVVAHGATEKATLVDQVRLAEQESLNDFTRKAEMGQLTLKDALQHANLVKKRKELEENTALKNRQAIKIALTPLLTNVAEGICQFMHILHEVETQG